MNMLEQLKEKGQAAAKTPSDFTDMLLGRLKDYMEDMRKSVFLNQSIILFENYRNEQPVNKTGKSPTPAALEAYEQLASRKGDTYFIGDWLTVDQKLINQFSQVTEDNQWIHTDVQRASKSPFRSTIAQGFLTLSMIPRLTNDIEVTYEEYANAKFVVNVGLNSVRFPTPVKSGSRVRATKKIVNVDLMKRGVQITEEVIVEIENLSRPACVAETIILLML